MDDLTITKPMDTTEKLADRDTSEVDDFMSSPIVKALSFYKEKYSYDKSLNHNKNFPLIPSEAFKDFV